MPNTIIQLINPFGFEDVRIISISEMKSILSSGEKAGIEIIKTIYNKIENKNFYKPNISRQEIACLNVNFNLTIFKSREFCDALFDRCITFLHHMLYLCKNEYSRNNIKYMCYVKYERYLLAKIIFYFFTFIFNIFTLILKYF